MTTIGDYAAAASAAAGADDDDDDASHEKGDGNDLRSQ